MMRFRILLMFALLSLAWGGCTHVYTAHGVYYRTRQGDTLESVAKRYRTSVQDLAEVNNIEHPKDVRVGTSLYIPGVTPSKFAAILEKEGIPVRSVQSVARQEPERGAKSKVPDTTEVPVAARHPEKGELVQAPEPLEDSSPIKTDRGRFAWPVEGDISSLYGMRHGRRHDGIDIRAKTGTPVYASADGEVVYAKRMRGYGNLVLLKHEGDFFTVYAHNSVNLVKLGASIKKGQMVSRVGRTGRATGPHLHFEVREGAKARNPLFFMPKTLMAEKAKETKGVAYGGPDGEIDGDAEAEDP
jgi:murein DD-endopeptidase MepM/ murein hydrolase activator NlpD